MTFTFSSAQKSELLRGVDGQALVAVRQAGIVPRVNASHFNLLLRFHALMQNALAVVGNRAEEMFRRVHLTGERSNRRIVRGILGLIKQGTAKEDSIPITGQDWESSATRRRSASAGRCQHGNELGSF